MTQTPLRWPGSVGLGDEPAVETQVIDVPVEAIRGNRPQPKGKEKPTKQPAKAIAPYFQIAHGQIWPWVGLYSFAAIIGQGVIGKVQAETGIPMVEIYWYSLMVAFPGIFYLANKTGNDRLFRMGIELAIALPISTGGVQLMKMLF